jgi:death-on-curing protein
MNPGSEPRFLTREAVDAIHKDQIDRFGGRHGVRDENALESAIAAAQNVYHYGSGDLYEVGAAYAFHLAESQAYFDGNKRTGVEAALVFLEGSGIDASRLPEQQTYDLMIRIAAHEAGRSDFADHLRSELGREGAPDRDSH